MGFADDHGSGYHPMYIKSDDTHQKADTSFMWVFALVIIFLALVFLSGRNRDGGSGLAEVAAIGAMNQNGSNLGADSRAAFTEINGRFDAITQQIGHINDVNDLRDLKSTQAALGLQIAGNRTDTLLNFKDLNTAVLTGNAGINSNIDGVRLQNQQNTCDIIRAVDQGNQRVMDRIDLYERDRIRDDLASERAARRQAESNSYLIDRLRPYPAPTFGVFPPIPIDQTA